MSLSFRGPTGTEEYRWLAYALLRDNIVHYLAKGPDEYPCIREAAMALGGKTVTVPARALRAEIEAAQDALLSRPIEELAVSIRTRAMLMLEWPLPPQALETSLAAEMGWSSPLLQGAKTLDDVFGYVVRGLLAITENAKEDSRVQVVDL